MLRIIPANHFDHHNPTHQITLVINDDSSNENSSSNDDNSSEESIDSEIENTSIRCIHKGKLLWAIPCINGVNQMAQTSMSLTKANFSLSILMALSMLSFATSMVMTGRFTIDGIQETYEILKNREIPDDWPELSKRKRKLAIGMGALVAAYVVLTDSILSYYYIDSLPEEYKFQKKVNEYWKILCVFIASITGITTAFGEGIETIIAMQELLGDNELTYTNKLNKFLSLTIGISSGFFGAVQDSIFSFRGMKTVFSINSLPKIAIIASLSSFNGIADFSLNGRFNIKNINRFIDSFYQDRPNIKNILAFMLSAGMASFMAFVIKNLSRKFWDDISSDFEIESYTTINTIADVVSYGAATNEFIVDTGAFYPVSYFIITKIENAFNHVYEKISNLFYKPQPIDPEEQKLLLAFAEDYDDEKSSNEGETSYYKNRNCSTFFTCGKNKNYNIDNKFTRQIKSLNNMHYK